MHQHIDLSTQELAALHIEHHEKVLGKVSMEHGWTDASRGLPAKFGWGTKYGSPTCTTRIDNHT